MLGLMAFSRPAVATEPDSFTIETWRKFCAVYAAQEAHICFANLTGDTFPFAAQITYETTNELVNEPVYEPTAAPPRHTYESGGIRPYVQMRVGQAVIIDPSSVNDTTLESPSGEPVLGFSFGLDLNDYFGVELAVDNFETDLNSPRADLKAGEYAVWTALVQARLRAANWRPKLTPYLLVGAGAAHGQFNDRNVLLAASLEGAPEVSPIIGGGDISFAASVGAGIEYFVARNIALGVEARYLFLVAPEIETVNGDETVAVDALYYTATARIYLDDDGGRETGRTARDTDDTRYYVAVRAGVALFTQPDGSNGVSVEGQGSQVGAAAVGVNLNKHFGFELATEYTETQVAVEGSGPVAEFALWTLIAQARVRYPIWDDRFVPYVVVGGGIGFGQINDRIVTATRVRGAAG